MASKTIVANLTHPQRVRLLYKTCLKLHRGLPDQMQIIGDAYVKEEFKRHKSATPEQTAAFMEAWAVSGSSDKYFVLSKIRLFSEIRSHNFETDQCKGASEKCCDRSRSGREGSGRLQWWANSTAVRTLPRNLETKWISQLKLKMKIDIV